MISSIWPVTDSQNTAAIHTVEEHTSHSTEWLPQSHCSAAGDKEKAVTSDGRWSHIRTYCTNPVT